MLLVKDEFIFLIFFFLFCVFLLIGSLTCFFGLFFDQFLWIFPKVCSFGLFLCLLLWFCSLVHSFGLFFWFIPLICSFSFLWFVLLTVSSSFLRISSLFYSFGYNITWLALMFPLTISLGHFGCLFLWFVPFHIKK